MALNPLLTNNVQTFFVNPSNLKPASEGFFLQDEIIESVPVLFLVMGSVNGGILLIGLFMYQELPRESNQEETKSSELTIVYQTSRQSCSNELRGPITKDVDCTITINNEILCPTLQEDSVHANVDIEQPHTDGDVELHVSPKQALKMKELYLLSIVCICSYHPLMFVNVFI
ncbi:uncharacterized protein LOC111084327, partial [Limulus polyphemus]|uniref:Uncharacterized protein LOC111084327 n=1 Tax=Limulus polyphemus TaxID=6850 RepID=A0ABM1RZH0_LIMPO